MRTVRTSPNNKPDSVISDTKQGTYMLIEAVIPGDGNFTKKEAEKILQYKELIIKIQPT